MARFFVAKNGRGDFETIQEAVDAAVDGDRIIIDRGVYEESVEVDKSLDIRGSGNGTIVDPGGAGNGFTITGDYDDIRIENLQIRNADDDGIEVRDAEIERIILDDLLIRDSDVNGFDLNTGNNAEVDYVEITDSTFIGNGSPQTFSGDGDILFFQYEGDALLKNLTVRGVDDADGAGENGIQFIDNDSSIGNVTLEQIRVSGEYAKTGVAIYNYDDVDNLTMQGVRVTADTGFNAAVNFDGIGDDIDFTNLRQFAGVRGGQDPLSIQGDGSNQTLKGTDRGDFIRGRGGDDTLSGEGGNDTIVGDNGGSGTGNDDISGGDGRDTILGEDGDDNIAGDGGNDLLNGGGGDDDFVFESGDGFDRIEEFNDDGDDTIIFIDTRFDEFSELRFTQRGNDLEVNAGGVRVLLEDENQGTVTSDDFEFV